MSLKTGSQVKAQMMGVNLTIASKLGEGAQGVVYEVTGQQGQYALKWYNADQGTVEQHSAIQTIVQDGPPKGLPGRRFVWPLDVVTSTESPSFGYLMPLIDKERFAELEEVQAHLKPAPSYPTLCEICYQAANSYRALHLTGRCYRDVSSRNVVFDPKTGDVLICDNDNVGVNRQSTSQVWGTMEFMAPELVREEAQPSTETDLHSLVVLLFNLWVWHHPLHGAMEFQFRSWDQIAKKKVYGKDPVFIFDPVDKRNCLPNDPGYLAAGKRWMRCPARLRDLFTQAFTVGMKDPARRITEGEWQSFFRQLKDGALPCPHCNAENLWDATGAGLTCWHCKKALSIPPRLVITQPRGKHVVLLNKGAKVLKRHLVPAAEEDGSTVVGEVIQNAANPYVWGIKNLTPTPWTGTLPGGTAKEYPPQIAVPLNPGIKLNIGGILAEILA